MPVDKWNSKKLVKTVGGVMEKRMARAMLILQGDVQRRLSVGQPVVRSKSGNLRGTVQAEPAPVPPRVLTSRLRTSITNRVEIVLDVVVGRVGTNVPYARRLELGFFGTDSKGRNFNQEARPYLRPSLTENLPRLLKILMPGP